jgi:hypothetical protein
VLVPFTARIGVALALVGIALYVGWRRWVASRTWLPLDIPVSMSRGQIKTGEFKINVKSKYWIYVEVERKFDFDGVPCLLGLGFDECNNTPSVLKASWSLSDSGRVVAQGSSDEEQGMLGGTKTMGRGIGTFRAGKGQHYALTVDILEDGSRLNVGNPRLRIEEMGGIYEQYDSRSDAVFLVAALVVVAGLILIIRSIIVQRENRGRRTAGCNISC